jgi:hypothetical protein
LHVGSQHTLGARHLSTDLRDKNKEVEWGDGASLVCGAVFLEHDKTLQFNWDWEGFSKLTPFYCGFISSLVLLHLNKKGILKYNRFCWIKTSKAMYKLN